MKKLVCLMLILGSLLSACGGGGGSDAPAPKPSSSDSAPLTIQGETVPVQAFTPATTTAGTPNSTPDQNTTSIVDGQWVNTAVVTAPSKYTPKTQLIIPLVGEPLDPAEVAAIKSKYEALVNDGSVVTIKDYTVANAPVSQYAKDDVSGTFNTIISDVTSAKATADLNGDTVVVPAILFVQGRGDLGNAKYQMMWDFYSNYIDSIAASYSADIQAVTGQTTKVPLDIAQIPATDSLVWPIASIFIATSNSYNLIVAGTMYPGASVSTMFAKSMNWMARTGRKWLPLMLQSATYDGKTTITAKFSIPVPPLKFQSTSVNLHGFDVVSYDAASNPAGTPLPISSVKMTPTGDYVYITVPNGIPAGQTFALRYGYSDGGDLVDSDSTGNNPAIATTAMISVPTEVWHPPTPVVTKRAVKR